MSSTAYTNISGPYFIKANDAYELAQQIQKWGRNKSTQLTK